MPLNGKKILVVEDHSDTAEMVQTLLKWLGYQTVIATNGLAALELAYQAKPDLILLDIVLPGISGLEVAHRLKEDAHTSAIPILALTAQGMPGDRERCLGSGCDAYLAKPVFHWQLEAEIERLLILNG